MKVNPWIEAMRLRTLPVSIAGVLAGCAVAIAYDSFHWLPAIICLVFAVLAQIVSNFANEYFDFKNGLDRRGRQGFRRGVTEGDIKPEAMKKAMIALMAIDCLIGCSLIYWGGFWLVAVGILIAIAAFAYSAGPWPLSHHALGDEAVILFYGIVPVTLTAYLQCGGWSGGYLAEVYGEMWKMALIVAVAVGLLGDNVLIVNNIRDVKDDAKVHKNTKAVMLGVRFMRVAYTLSVFIGIALLWYAFRNQLPSWGWAGFTTIAVWYLPIIYALFKFSDHRLNKVLRFTAMMMLASIIWCLVCLLGH